MGKEKKNRVINVGVSYLWTTLIIFLVLGGFFMCHSAYDDPIFSLGGIVGLFGIIFYLAGCFIVWYFAFDSISMRYKWIKK